MTEWLRLKRLERNRLPLPKYETEWSAGVDFAACLTRPCKEVAPATGTKRKFLVVDKGGHGFHRHYFGEDKIPDIITSPNGPENLTLIIRPQETVMVALGWSSEFGQHFVLNIHVRSSVGLMGLSLSNGTGIVDPDYRGELFACLSNRTNENIEIKHGQRIVQGVLLKFNQAIVKEVDELTPTERGNGGFGSTGLDLNVSGQQAKLG